LVAVVVVVLEPVAAAVVVEVFFIGALCHLKEEETMLLV
jgi:hypothetical protein